MFDHVHREPPIGARVNPAVKGDNGRPLNLGPCFKIIPVGDGFGSPFHGCKDDALGKPVLDGGSVNAVEVGFRHMGD